MVEGTNPVGLGETDTNARDGTAMIRQCADRGGGTLVRRHSTRDTSADTALWASWPVSGLYAYAVLCLLLKPVGFKLGVSDQCRNGWV